MCLQLLATSAPSLGWTSLETSTVTGSLPSLPSVYPCSPVVWQWCNKTVVQCSECPWLRLSSALWLLHLFVPQGRSLSKSFWACWKRVAGVLSGALLSESFHLSAPIRKSWCSHCHQLCIPEVDFFAHLSVTNITEAKAEVQCVNSQNLNYEVLISDAQLSSAVGIHYSSVKIFHLKK